MHRSPLLLPPHPTPFPVGVITSECARGTSFWLFIENCCFVVFSECDRCCCCCVAALLPFLFLLVFFSRQPRQSSISSMTTLLLFLLSPYKSSRRKIKSHFLSRLTKSFRFFFRRTPFVFREIDSEVLCARRCSLPRS